MDSNKQDQQSSTTKGWLPVTGSALALVIMGIMVVAIGGTVMMMM
jgi:hypothetical protein